MNASPKYFREQAAAHRATAAEDPDDPRYPSGSIYEASAYALARLTATLAFAGCS